MKEGEGSFDRSKDATRTETWRSIDNSIHAYMRSNIRDMKANDRTFIKAIVLRNRRRNSGEVALPEDPR